MDCDEAVLVVETLTIDTIMIPHLIDVYNLRFGRLWGREMIELERKKVTDPSFSRLQQ